MEQNDLLNNSLKVCDWKGFFVLFFCSTRYIKTKNFGSYPRRHRTITNLTRVYFRNYRRSKSVKEPFFCSIIKKTVGKFKTNSARNTYVSFRRVILKRETLNGVQQKSPSYFLWSQQQQFDDINKQLPHWFFFFLQTIIDSEYVHIQQYCIRMFAH